MNMMVSALSLKAGQSIITSLHSAPVSIENAIVSNVGVDASVQYLPDVIQVTAAEDPFTNYHTDILALHKAMEGQDDDVADPLMRQWREIDDKALASEPTTLAGALGALQYARREFLQFQTAGGGDESKALLRHLVEGAIAVLEQETSKRAA